MPPPPDRHVRRSGKDYAEALLALLPQGQVWTRDPQSILVKTVRGLSEFWGFVDGRIADLLERESDPRKTTDVTLESGLPDGLLLDWERNWGLPDECFPPTISMVDRQRMLVTKITWLGGQSRKYFIDLMAWLGYTIEIEEFSPFMAGVSNVGDTRPQPDLNFRWYIGPPEQRFVWTVNIGQIGLTWFRAASGQAGVNHHLEFGIPETVQCLLDRWKPAHTIIVPDFSEISYGDPMQGTP